VHKNFISKLKIGSSVAIDGVCLTVTKKTADTFFADVMPETWKKTMIGSLKKGNEVNLELPMKADGSLDGHIVQGHVDGIGTLKNIKKLKDSTILSFSTQREIAKYLVPKGSITINGISLTVIDIKRGQFSVGIIPHTWKNTMLHNLKKEDEVNLEVDVLAKHIYSYLHNGK
jgi:riboflavin synthase